MKIEWLVTNVTAVGSPDRAEHAILRVFWLGDFLANSGPICGQGANLWYGNPLLSPNTFNYCHLMKIEWFVANVLFWGDFGWAFFWPIQAVFVAWEPICGIRTPSGALITLFRVIWWKYVVGNQCNNCRIPWKSETCYFAADFGRACFWPIQVVFVVREPLCGVETPSWALIFLLRVI